MTNIKQQLRACLNTRLRDNADDMDKAVELYFKDAHSLSMSHQDANDVMSKAKDVLTEAMQ